MKIGETTIESGGIKNDLGNTANEVIKGLTSIKYQDRKGRMYASDAGQCERRAMLSATGNGMEITTPVMETYFKLGIAIEELVLDSLYAQKVLLFKDFRVEDIGLNLGGKIDGITYIGGKVRVLEVKSCGAMPSKPKPTHAAQTAVYAAITGLPATILYVSRTVAGFNGPLRIKDFEIEADHENDRSLIFRVAYSHLAIQMGVIPNRPLSITKESHCGYCGFKATCWHGAPLPDKYPEVTVEQHLELIERASVIADTLLDPAEVDRRRGRVLSFLRDNGNRHAKRILKGILK